jgi:hypothetical protein
MRVSAYMYAIQGLALVILAMRHEAVVSAKFVSSFLSAALH